MSRHISNTQLNMASRCGEQYRRRYILGEKIPPAVALILGTATHVPIEHNLRHKIETKQLLPADEIKDLARDSVNERWEREGVTLNDEEQQKGADRVRGDAVDMAIHLSLLHHDTLAPLIEPAHVERRWELELAGYDCTLTGVIDIQETSPHIIDTKTARRRPFANAASKSQQLTIYAMASKVLDGVIPEVSIHSLVKTRSKRKQPAEWRGIQLPDDVDVQTSTRTPDEFQPVLRRVESLITSIENDIFLPTTPDNWVCDRRYCGYFDSCLYVNGKRRPTS